jgi:NAD(P)-dependent dehydrogenase (short-subunit alcohol dehydrogenase family)
MTATAQRKWTADDIPDLSGRTFVVTGANSGLGYESTRALARHGGHVVMGVRNGRKGEAALAQLASELPDARLELRHLDLADLESVREFADRLIADRLGIDVLINNAGVMMPPRSLTAQGFETQFGANHLGHFALTGRLLRTIRAGQDPRVVTVSSGLHRRGEIHFDDLTGERSYSPSGYYAQSKLANVLFALELDRRLRAAAVPVRSLVAHPGYAATNLQSGMGSAGRLMNLGIKIGNALVAQSAAEGARSQLYAATDPGAESGQFIGPRGRNEMRGAPGVVRPAPAGADPARAARLWELSEELTGVRYEL